ncbi:hypothetical protein [Pedobacter nototheniae]|uniref:hypothetical protein n=1 Tax=Pedobacter nototheniae TaxID=2488994 RepID=UPI00292FE238|nr:hypothetical protein [Pedobacter nototheniae]
MKIHIEDLEIDLKERFQKEINYWYFEIIDIFYSGFDSVSIAIGHYSDQKFNYKFDFSGVYSYRIIQESYYNSAFSDENYHGSSFLQIADTTRYKNDILINTLLGEIMSSSQDIHKIKTYRLICHNSFIDVLTSKEPIIEVVETE